MRAALDAEVTRIKANVFKLVEFDKAYKLVFFWQLKYIAALFINEQSIK